MSSIPNSARDVGQVCFEIAGRADRKGGRQDKETGSAAAFTNYGLTAQAVERSLNRSRPV
jgi:hypothetical protein